MNFQKLLQYFFQFIVILSMSFFGNSLSFAKSDSIDIIQKTADTQVRRLLEPLLEKYCHDACKLMGVHVIVDHTAGDELAPGFDDLDSRGINELAPSSAQIKLLIDDKVGPVSRNKLLELIQQYLDTLDFPVKIDAQTTHFPLPQGSEGKVVELREKISKQFSESIQELIRQFCPQHCLLADFELQTEIVNGEEAQFGTTGEFIQDGDTAVKIKNISATLLMDESLTPQEQANILEMAKLKSNSFKHVTLKSRSLQFPKPFSNEAKNDSKKEPKRSIASENPTSSEISSPMNAKSTPTPTVTNAETLEKEIQRFKIYSLVFACGVLVLLLLIALATTGRGVRVQPVAYPPYSSYPNQTGKMETQTHDSSSSNSLQPNSNQPNTSNKNSLFSTRFEIDRLQDELTSIYAQQPKVAKQVFSKILTEEGVEILAKYLFLFGEGIVLEMLRDPSLQSDLSQLLEFYAKNPMQLADQEKIELLRKLHHRTVAGKLTLMGNRASSLFDFLSEMDAFQILELIKSESLTVKSIVLTQVDPQKRSKIYSQLDADTRMQLLTELTRIEYLPKDFIQTVSESLRIKIRENPKLDTESLPGSEVLVSLLEKTGQTLQKTVLRNLEASNPESARTVKSKLISIETLKFLRDGQLLEIILSLKHEELIQFLQGSTDEIKSAIFTKAPKELTVELEEELEHAAPLSRESFQTVERKVLNKIKTMANEGHVNLLETNERMFSDIENQSAFVESIPTGQLDTHPSEGR